MTGLGSSEMNTVVESELAVAHLVFKVADLKRSCEFYSNLGIPPFAMDGEVALIELRGGTHLLLLEVDQLAGGDVAESVTGQFHKRFSEQFDLMIKARLGNSWVRIQGTDATCGKWSRRNAADRLSRCEWRDHQVHGQTV